MAESRDDTGAGDNLTSINDNNEANTSTQNTEVVSSPLKKAKKERTLKAKIWKEYHRFQDDTGVWKARCNHCSLVLCGDTVNGTSSLTKHTNQVCKKRPREDSTQTLLKEGFESWKYDPVVSRQKLAKMLILEELPFRLVDGDGFKDFVASLNPRFRIPSRFTAQRDCYAIYQNEKDRLMKFLNKANRRVSLTTDTWTSVQNMSYMCITLHYINDDWKICKILLSFVPIDSHSGRGLANAVSKELRKWGISKIFTITVDNASSNDLMLKHLKDEYGANEGSVLGGKCMHLRCAAHILNLVCVDGLKLKDPHVSICRIRDAVRYVKQSSNRLLTFKKCMAMENDVGKVELCLDVKTRWNSTYFMLDSALRHEKVWKRFEQEDKRFDVDLELGPPVASDWEYARTLHTFLKAFYDLTLKISGSKYVTSNAFWGEIFILNGKLKKLIDGDDVSMKDIAEKMKEKFDKYWGDVKKMNKLLFVAVVLDPRSKFAFLDYTLDLTYDVDVATTMKTDIKEFLSTLFKHYKDMLQPTVDKGDLNASFEVQHRKGKGVVEDVDEIVAIRKTWRGRAGHVGKKSDLELYLEEAVVDDDEEDDILMWWRKHAIRFPILSRLARDVLAMPTSTVSSESAFSTGGRVLDSFRSSLAPTTVEVLLCCQDWIRGSFIPTNVEESVEEQEQIALEFSQFTLDETSKNKGSEQLQID